MYYLHISKSHALAESDQSHVIHEYHQIKEPKQSIPHQSSANEEQYAVSLKAVNNTSEKQQQQQVPLVEYAEIDHTTQNKNQQLHSSPRRYDEISENKIATDEEVSIHNYTCAYVRDYVFTPLV